MPDQLSIENRDVFILGRRAVLHRTNVTGKSFFEVFSPFIPKNRVGFEVGCFCKYRSDIVVVIIRSEPFCVFSVRYKTGSCLLWMMVKLVLTAISSLLPVEAKF